MQLDLTLGKRDVMDESLKNCDQGAMQSLYMSWIYLLPHKSSHLDPRSRIISPQSAYVPQNRFWARILTKFVDGWPISSEVTGGSIEVLELLPEEKGQSSYGTEARWSVGGASAPPRPDTEPVKSPIEWSTSCMVLFFGHERRKDGLCAQSILGSA